MKILVTGASGFLGSAFLECLGEDSKKDSILLYTSKQINGYRCLVYNSSNIKNKSLQEKIDTLVCIGGFVPKSNRDQVDGYKHASAIIHLQVLLNSLPNTPSKIIYCSSVEVYGRGVSEVIREESLLKPYNLYSAQKLMCEGIVQKYSKEHDCQFLILRLGPMYGKRDTRTDCFLPGIIYKALRNENIIISVSPDTKRNYIYVKDVAGLIWRCVHNNVDGIINIVSKNNISLGDISRIVVTATNSNSTIISNSNNYGEQLMFDNRKMEKELGLESYSFTDGISETVNWIRGQV